MLGMTGRLKVNRQLTRCYNRYSVEENLVSCLLSLVSRLSSLIEDKQQQQQQQTISLSKNFFKQSRNNPNFLYPPSCSSSTFFPYPYLIIKVFFSFLCFSFPIFSNQRPFASLRESSPISSPVVLFFSHPLLSSSTLILYSHPLAPPHTPP